MSRRGTGALDGFGGVAGPVVGPARCGASEAGVDIETAAVPGEKYPIDPAAVSRVTRHERLTDAHVAVGGLRSHVGVGAVETSSRGDRANLAGDVATSCSHWSLTVAGPSIRR